MAKRKHLEDEEYEYSMKSEDAIRLYYPESITPAHPFFERMMIELQVALIEGHLPVMFASDKKRALKTARELKAKLRAL